MNYNEGAEVDCNTEAALQTFWLRLLELLEQTAEEVSCSVFAIFQNAFQLLDHPANRANTPLL